MPGNREDFLARVRQAVVEGNRAGTPREFRRDRHIGYQGAGNDPVARFSQELTAVGGHCYVVNSAEEATGKIAELLSQSNARHVILGQGEVLDKLSLSSVLTATQVWREPLPTPLSPPSQGGDRGGGSSEETKETLFRADVGITAVEHLIAETGTIVLASRPGQSRSLSLLPPVHIAVAQRRQLLADLYDLFSTYDAMQFGSLTRLPACIAIITGPSKTGDIELRLVTGVHGPGEVHVVLIDS